PGVAMVCSRDFERDTAGLAGVLGSTCDGQDSIKETNALSFTTAPVGEATQYSGTANLHLNVATPATEAIWHISVNDVAPDGTSVVRSTGALVSTRRVMDDTRSRRLSNGDYTDAEPSLRSVDTAPVIANQPHTVDIKILPTDLVLQPGHRLRINILATNITALLPTLEQALNTQLAPQTVLIDTAAPSYLTLPIVGDGSLGIVSPNS
ncbi:CocE/NonD family hydrolase C-terminal non-catalytic domain-containing protein, partial [Nocardia brasiliensis]|uniref:CocE/NonD family hydrolase C-terminal non-catalytic domain-containing protein n=1 Tax=Nocardia brasiliensis TaxID=37326 RepID=UPI0033FDCB05